MTLTLGNRVSLSPGDWIKVLTFLAVQTVALIGVGVDMRERQATRELAARRRKFSSRASPSRKSCLLSTS
jgi:hypothetical protein